MGLKETTINSRLAEAPNAYKNAYHAAASPWRQLGTAAPGSDTVLASALTAKMIAAVVPAAVISERIAALVSGMTKVLILQKAKVGAVVFLV